MFDFFVRLFDASGFPPRSGGGWTDELKWLHIGSDLFIGLAYFSILLLLVYFVRKRNDLPFSRLFGLCVTFILMCGLTHFLDAILFTHPMHRLVGLVKFVTAVVSWITVVAMVASAPRILDMIAAAGRVTPDTTLHRPISVRQNARLLDYIIAILAAVLSLLIRAALDKILVKDQIFVMSLLAVVFVSWQYGFGPGLVTLLVSMVGFLLFFVSEPRQPFVVKGLGNQIAVALFFFCGVACCALGEAQRYSQQKAKQALAAALEQQGELEAEVNRRRVVEYNLRQREEELLAANQHLAAAQWETTEALAQLDAFLDNAPVGIAFFDTDMRYRRVNSFLATANGHAVAEHTGKRVFDMMPEFPADVEAEYQAAARPDGHGFRRKFQRASSQQPGEIRTWQVTVFPVRVEQNRSLGIGVITEDVTERERATAALAESEARYRTLIMAVPQIVWVARPDGSREYSNAKWYEFTGMTIEQSADWGWMDALHPDDRSESEAKWRHAVETGEEFEVARRYRGTNGEYRWFLGRALPQRDETGAIVRWFGTSTDIHDAKVASEALQHSEERFRTLTEAVPQMVWTADPSGRVTFFNQRWYDYTGFQLAGGGIDDWGRAFHPDDTSQVDTSWRLAVAQGADRYTQQFRLRRVTDGQYRWMLSNAIPRRNADGEVVEWVGSLTDIDDQKRQAENLERTVRERTAELETTNHKLVAEVDERRRAEERVEATARELKRSNVELEQFAYIASHDLQEPLRKIQSFGDLLLTKCRNELSEEGRLYTDKMRTGAGRMRRLIDDLLSLSRITSQGKPYAPVDLTDLVNQVVSDLDVRLDQVAGVVDVGSLPTIDADPSQMRQLFQNLIVNALKFHKPGVSPVVRVRGEILATSGDGAPFAERCRLTVEDNGIGFEEKYRSRIFQVFQRLHGRGEYEGTGVGLAICQKIAERHGGTITAQGEPGVGATFVVTLPVRQPIKDVLTNG